MNLKPEFLTSLIGLPGCDPEALATALDTASPVSIRLNPFKIAQRPEGDPVPWCRYGYYLDERPNFTLDPALHGGAYYVQEAGSMIVEHLMREAFGGDCEGLRVLDLCAAPGGKTTLLSTLVGLEGVVVANETVRQRTAPLIDNVTRWGLGNVMVTHNDPETFGSMRDVFDAVLVDAPCSGEGMMRKNDAARSEWSPSNVHLCAARQRRIVADVWNALKPGGVMIYSTCTFNRQENEQNVEWMLSEFDCEGVDINIDPSWGVVQGKVADVTVYGEITDNSEQSIDDGRVVYGQVVDGRRVVSTVRVYPDKVRAEGFFAAVIRKSDGKRREKLPPPRGIAISEVDRASAAELSRWVEQPEFMHFARIGDNNFAYYAAAWPFMRQMGERLSAVHSGVPMGQIFHGKLRADHPLALFTGFARGVVPEVDLDEQQALAYLRKQDCPASLFEEGANLVCFEGLPLGWIKRIGMRVNNLYPKELRILH